MGHIVSTASGKGNAGATWTGGVPPGVADTFEVASTHVVEFDTTEVMLFGVGNISTIKTGGELQITGTSGDLKLGTMAMETGGKFTAPGSGDKANPSYLRCHGINPAGAPIWGVDADFDMTAETSDFEIVGLGSGKLDFENLHFTGIFAGLKISGAWSSYAGYRWKNNSFTDFEIKNIIFDSLTDLAIYLSNIRDIGTILCLNATSTWGFASVFVTNAGKLLVRDPAAITNGLSTVRLWGNSEGEVQNSTDSSIVSFNSIMFTNNAIGTVVDTIDNAGYIFNNSDLLENASLNATLMKAAPGTRIIFFGVCRVNTTGTIYIDAQGCDAGVTVFYQTLAAYFTSLEIILNSTLCSLASSMVWSNTWVMSRAKKLKIVGASSVSHASSLVQFEPIAYDAHLTDNLMTIQHDLDSDTPNYSDLYEFSGWTASTNSLADAGFLKFKTYGWHDTPTSGRTAMNNSILSFAAAAHSNTGTFTEGAGQAVTYQVSHDGGVTYSAEITLAQLQSNDYTIGGSASTQAGTKDTQVIVIYRNTSGAAKTITKQICTGWKFDPAPPTAGGMTVGEQYAAMLDAIDGAGGGYGIPSLPYTPVLNNVRYAVGVALAVGTVPLTASTVSVNVELTDENTNISTQKVVNLVKALTAGHYVVKIKQLFPTIEPNKTYTYFISSGGTTVDTVMGKIKVIEDKTKLNISVEMETFKRQIQQQVDSVKKEIKDAANSIESPGGREHFPGIGPGNGRREPEPEPGPGPAGDESDN